MMGGGQARTRILRQNALPATRDDPRVTLIAGTARPRACTRQHTAQSPESALSLHADAAGAGKVL